MPRFLKVFFLLLICTHLAACTWFFVGYTTMDSHTDSWLSSKFGTNRPHCGCCLFGG